MSEVLLKKIVRYRNIAVALVNAGATWIILIIAPLGLFAVIICTIAVFLSSLAVGYLGDLAVVSLFNEDERSRMRERRNQGDFRENRGRQIDPKSDHTFSQDQPRGDLPDDGGKRR